MTASDKLEIAIVVERRASDHPWLDHDWVICGVSLDVAGGETWTLLYQAAGVQRYLSPGVLLELHKGEAEAYLYNLESPRPSIFTVLREADEDADDEVPIDVHLVTVSPYEAQDYLDSSEEHVEAIALQPELAAWMERFVAEHYEEEEFRKRKRDRLKIEDYKFGQEPLIELRRRGHKDDKGRLH